MRQAFKRQSGKNCMYLCAVDLLHKAQPCNSICYTDVGRVYVRFNRLTSRINPSVQIWFYLNQQGIGHDALQVVRIRRKCAAVRMFQ
jgi:hypothetical protein